MEITLARPKRGQNEAERDRAVVGNMLLSCFEVGVYMRIVMALEEGSGVEFYVDDRSEEVAMAIAKLSELGMLVVRP